MKKLLALLCAAVMLCAPLAACADGSENSDDDGGGKITVPEPDDDPQTPVTPQKPLVYNEELEEEMLELYSGQFGATDGILHSFGIFGDYTAVVEFDSYVVDAMTVVPVAGRQFVFCLPVPIFAPITAANSMALMRRLKAACSQIAISPKFLASSTSSITAVKRASTPQ